MSILQAMFHTTTLSGNTNTIDNKIKTWTTLDVITGAGKYGE